MQNFLSGATFGILITTMVYHIFGDVSQEDKEAIVMQSFSWFIVNLIIRIGVFSPLLNLIIIMLVAFWVNPGLRKIIKRKYTEQKNED